MNTASPTKICDCPEQRASGAADSPATGDRQIESAEIPTSSSAHPVNPTAPVMPVALSSGVSTPPKGATEDPDAEAPACVMVKVRVPMLMVPTRRAVVGFAATV